MKPVKEVRYQLAATVFVTLYVMLFLASQVPVITKLLPHFHWTSAFQVATVFLFLIILFGYQRYRQMADQTEGREKSFRQQVRQLKRAHREEKERLSIVLDSGRLAFWEWNIKKNTAYFSDRWQDMIGFDGHDFPQDLSAWQNRIHPLDQETVQKQLLKILSNQETEYENTHRLMNTDGDYIWVYDRGQAIFNDSGDIEKLSCVRIDVSAQKSNEEQLTLDKILLENTQEAIAITNETLDFIRTNPAFHQAFGFTEQELETLSLRQLLDNLQDEPPLDILSIVDEQGSWRGELTLHHENGDLARSSLIDLQKITHQTSQTTHYALVYTDISELKQTQKELNFLANTDIVTGLPNRNHFYQVLEATFQEFRHTDQRFTLMFMDLDNFKTVNDTLGHDIGDDLLKSVSALISNHLAPDTLFARVGGDEFVILCKAYTTEEQLQMVGENLNQLLSQPVQIGEHNIQIGSSIGMAIYPEHGANQATLLKHADQAMYQAKHAGKGRYQIFQLSSSGH